jgi:hypothetical protein
MYNINITWTLRRHWKPASSMTRITNSRVECGLRRPNHGLVRFDKNNEGMENVSLIYIQARPASFVGMEEE